MNGLRDLLDDYLATRRALGFKLTAPGKALDGFVGWMEEAGEPTIRRDLAIVNGKTERFFFHPCARIAGQPRFERGA